MASSSQGAENQGKNYLPRVVDALLEDQLEASGAVLIEGPKWCGKTWTGRQASASQIFLQAPDKRMGYLQAASTAPSLLLQGEAPRLLDEWQTVPVLWDAVRHEVDQRQEPGQFILTGSAVPFAGSTAHTGTGRIARLRMRPMSLFESQDSSGEVSLSSLFSVRPPVVEGMNPWQVEELSQLIVRGGWPTAIRKSPKAAALQMQNYIDAVAHEDVSRVDQVERNPQRVSALLASISRNIATQAAKTTICDDLAANDLSFSMPTLNDYLNTLERLFLLENLPAWNPQLRSKTAIRTTSKWHFVDPSIAVASLGASERTLLNDFNSFGYLFESMVLRDLRIYAEAIGGKLYHYRDKNELESDMVIVLRDGSWAPVEVKMGASAFDEASLNLQKFVDKVDRHRHPEPSFKLIVSATEYAFQRTDGTYVVPLGCLAP